jgi:hypothetical protein
MVLSTNQFSGAAEIIVRSCLAHDLPLSQTGECSGEAVNLLRQAQPQELFPKSRNAAAAVSGLFLRLGCWTECHELAQQDDSREGSYWHAIAHRIEPDTGNSNYWFRRVGEHPVYAPLYEHASEILAQKKAVGWTLKRTWQPELFNDWCDEARREPRNETERVALAIQNVEWELLFSWCALEA